MGGKRPDQYEIDPGEAGATDYKTMPQTGRGHSSLDDTVEIDRQKRARTETEVKQGSAPNWRPQPSRDANRPLRAKEDAQRDGQSEPDAAKKDKR